MSSSGKVVVFPFVLSSVIFGELIFVKGIKSGSRFIFSFHMRTSSYFSTICWKNDPYFQICLVLCQRSSGFLCVGLFLGSPFCSVHLSVLSPRPHWLDSCSLMVSLEVSISPSTFLPNIVWVLLNLLVFLKIYKIVRYGFLNSIFVFVTSQNTYNF